MESFRKLSVDEHPASEFQSETQLVGVLERLTLALKSPNPAAIGGDTQELVGVLERLTLALKSPHRKTEGNGAKSLQSATRAGESDTQ